MRTLLFALAVLVAVPAFAADPEIDTSEVLRLGDMVQHIDGISQDEQDVFVEAMGPPTSDADKWFISVLTMQGCAPCAKLKAQWETNEWLLALANPSDPKKSWAHYAVYSREDKSQEFRFKDMRIASYPTIIVQPPRTGRYGDPSTVVYQSSYGGDPEKLARQITDAIKRYVKTLESRRRDSTPASLAAHGQPPPWEPAPKNDPIGPEGDPVFPDGRPLIPPPVPMLVPVVTDLSTGWMVVLSVLGTLLVVFALLKGWPALNSVMERRLQERQAEAQQRQALAQLLSRLENANASTAVASATPVKASPAG